MKNLLSAFILVSACAVFTRTAHAQDVPGVSAGAFFESRTENRISNSDLTFDYYGLRLKVRDEGFIEGFVDLGIQGLDLKGVTADDEGAFGLGGTLWLTRADGDFLPVDAGIYGSVHVANYTLTSDDNGSTTDARHTRYMVQGVIRGFDTQALRPYLRAGILGTKLSPDDDGVLPSDDGLDEIKPAVNVGAEYSIGSGLVLTIEGNYIESVGGAIRLDYWF